jgi:hypothetical protein
MIRPFDIEENRIVPTVHCYTIEWLRDIIDCFPSCSDKALSYIFYMTCPYQDLNPMVNIPEIDKPEKIMMHLGIDPGKHFPADDYKIERAITEMRKLYSTPAMEAFLAAKSMLEKLKISFQVEELVWGGKESNGPALIAAMEKLPKLVQAYKDAELKLDQEMSGRSRGNQEQAYDIDEDDD